MAGSESQSFTQLAPLGPTSAMVPVKQPAPPRGTSAGNRAEAAAEMDAMSRLLLPPTPSSESREREDGVLGDGSGDADGRFFLPLGGMAATPLEVSVRFKNFEPCVLEEDEHESNRRRLERQPAGPGKRGGAGGGER